MPRRALVAQQLGRLAVVAQHEVEPPVAVVVEDREAAPILDAVGVVHPADLGEGPVAVVAEEAGALAAIETVVPEVQERPGALDQASTDALEHVPSEVGEDLTPGE